MSLTTCALSNSLVTEPVVSKKTGHVFEKSVITKHLESTGQCPLTGQEMSLDDLVDVNPNYSFSRPQTGNVTQSLKRMQTEWDSLMLENFQIRKHLNEMKEELAHNLYQHEAASLVICRLIRERDEALRKLQDFKINVQRVQQEEEEELQNEEEFDFMGIYDNLVEKFNDLSQELISKRKNREISKTLRNVDQIREYKIKASFPLHSSSKPGITCLDVNLLMSNLVVTGGNDAQLVLFDTNKEKTLFSTAGRGHTKKINDVKFYPGEDLLGFCSAGADSTAYFWLNDTSGENINGDLNFIERYRTNVHRAGITSLSFHPLGDYCLMTSRDKNWSFHNLVKGLCITKTQTDTDQEITKCQFHPDGNILLTNLRFNFCHRRK
jgi:pre-mRNA-processing factor 19